jgi:hypothetical protein
LSAPNLDSDAAAQLLAAPVVDISRGRCALIIRYVTRLVPQKDPTRIAERARQLCVDPRRAHEVLLRCREQARG